MAFLFVIQNIRKFYDPQNSNIAFLTLSQSPMLNGLNTGGFLIHDDIASTQMVDRILAMLNQYLISYKTLQQNRTFKVYLKILSTEHSKLKKSYIKIATRRKKLKVKLKVGGNERKPYIYRWAIDYPPNSDLEGQCLLIATILSIAQHDYFHSHFKSRKFCILQKITSKNTTKFRQAFKCLLKELKTLKSTLNLNDGPYDLANTLHILSNHYKCQFFVFDGTIKHAQRILLCYPEEFDSKLKPVFLYKPFASNHILFIRNIRAFFKNNGVTCLVCRKAWRSSYYRHFCKQSNNCCFACHRYFLLPETYFHSNLLHFYCDSKMCQNFEEKCPRCNLILSSQSCKKAHQVLCNSKGYFGYKCDKCNRFTFKGAHKNSIDIKDNHICSFRTCKTCFMLDDENHLCKMLQGKYPKCHTKLGFLHLVYTCTLKEPFLASILVEEDRGYFQNVLIAHDSFGFSPMDNFYYDYFSNVNLPNKAEVISKNCQHLQGLLQSQLAEKLSKSTYNNLSEMFTLNFLTAIFN
ncbi:MAG: hypothetical protein FJ333_11165, partial [Sphingomonadales bacterium]|nr:hypothetical protein [Sphingomonadales bacterium]